MMWLLTPAIRGRAFLGGRMNRDARRITLMSVPLLLVAAMGLATNVGEAVAAPSASSGTTRTISAAGTTTMQGTAAGDSAGISDPEFPATADGDTADAGGLDDSGFTIVNRSYSAGKVS